MSELLSGFRLKHVELFNWGTFHQRIWRFNMDGKNALLTGDIGSGKSTMVDAITTLLVPSQRIAYNRAAGAEAKERSLRSYVLGYYKSERHSEGHIAKPVALRDAQNYSVILGVFHNAISNKTVTLAQVFWLKDTVSQPARFYVIADRILDIQSHFTHFGSDINQLKKRLRQLDGVEPLFESYPPYAASFRRRFGISQEKALELFHQTVSMKSVGNLTEFVREHMLEAFDVAPRIEFLITHFDDLNRAHDAILKAKNQVEQLKPLAKDLASYDEYVLQKLDWRQSRDGLRFYFSRIKQDLLQKRIENLRIEAQKLEKKIIQMDSERAQLLAKRDSLSIEIAANGGDRLERLRLEIEDNEREKTKRQNKSVEYQHLAGSLNLRIPQTVNEFFENLMVCQQRLQELESHETHLQNQLTEYSVDFKTKQEAHAKLNLEIASLAQRQNNIGLKHIHLREELAKSLNIPVVELPFIGELLQVVEQESMWEGVIERLLHQFGLSLLVPDRHYEKVSEWVERTHLKGRLVYYRIPERVETAILKQLQENSLVDKIQIKSDSEFYLWLEKEIIKRFDYRCCTSLEDFRKSQQAVTVSGQIKSLGQRHEKDDRYRIDDRSQYILGWSNQAKIKVLELQSVQFEKALQKLADLIADQQSLQQKSRQEKTRILRLEGFKDFEELNWQSICQQISTLQDEKQKLESSSNLLKSLNDLLHKTTAEIKEFDCLIDKEKDLKSKNQARQEDAHEQLMICQQEILPSEIVEVDVFLKNMDALYQEILGSQILRVESCESAQQDMRTKLQKKIDSVDLRLKSLQERIIKAMEGYRRDYPAETKEFDARIESGPEYLQILENLQADGLPQFEKRFKALLNENTIREIANFQSQLHREIQDIKERVNLINQSLADIDYNPGRYICLEFQDNHDYEIRQFRADLKHCTEGSLTRDEDDIQDEQKFLQVKAIIERFKGRAGQTEIDKRWTQKVSDVRNWFAFAASERWKEDGSEHEHYTDSGGKSGGQKEKLAYTVLAASLAYQYGLKSDIADKRSFRFVMIDEAFGRGSDESARFGLDLFKKLNLQLLIVTPLQKIHIIEPYVSSVGFVHNQEGGESMLRHLSIEVYQQEKEAYLAKQ